MRHPERPFVQSTAWRGRPILSVKHPTVDFLIRLFERDHSGHLAPAYFFVQVKTTNAGRDTHGNLKARVEPEDLWSLNALPAPTYVVGVDNASKQAFIIASLPPSTDAGLPSIPTRFSLSETNTLEALWFEIP